MTPVTQQMLFPVAVLLSAWIGDVLECSSCCCYGLVASEGAWLVMLLRHQQQMQLYSLV